MSDTQAAQKKEEWVPAGDLQEVKDPEWLFNEAPREQIFITGSEAAR